MHRLADVDVALADVEHVRETRLDGVADDLGHLGHGAGLSEPFLEIDACRLLADRSLTVVVRGTVHLV